MKRHCCSLCKVLSRYYLIYYLKGCFFSVKAPTGVPPDPSVFTHLSLAEGCDDLWGHLCYGKNSSMCSSFVQYYHHAGCKLTVKDMVCNI